MTSIDQLFVSKLYRAKLGGARALNAELERTCLSIAREDRAGQRWSREHNYKGYTSYASLDDLPRRAPAFADLVTALAPHARAFARALDWQFAGRKLALDSLWINVMERGSTHSAHIHPQSAISGTYYVNVPKGSAPIRFEDPRLAMMMAAPPRKERARRENLAFVSMEPSAGTVLLWESFVRHEVQPNKSAGKRISVSFNYAMR